MEKVSLILGAGFSKRAANLPVLKQLFDWRVRPRNTREQRRIGFIRSMRELWESKTRGDRHPERFVSHMLRFSDRSRRAILWYITRRLSDPFIATILGGMQVLMIDDRRAGQHRGVARTRRFLQHFRGVQICGIVTPNYDLLVEYALGTRGFNYGKVGEVLSGRGKNPIFPWQGAWPRLNGTVRLAKLHGSTSWDSKNRYTDGRCGLRGNALIVLPEHRKLVPGSLRSTWDLAESILDSSQKAIVFGFSFSPYDRALLALLKRGGRNLESVLLVDVEPKVSGARAVFPSVKITCCPPPPFGLDRIKSWLLHGDR